MSKYWVSFMRVLNLSDSVFPSSLVRNVRSEWDGIKKVLTKCKYQKTQSFCWRFKKGGLIPIRFARIVLIRRPKRLEERRNITLPAYLFGRTERIRKNRTRFWLNYLIRKGTFASLRIVLMPQFQASHLLIPSFLQIVSKFHLYQHHFILWR